MPRMLAERTGQDATLIGDSWHHHHFPCALPTDLLDVLVLEEQWPAAKDGRTPRARAEPAPLIDTSVLDEALAQE